jgi:hypothetical protein
MTSWKDITGVKCTECGKPASHFYDAHYPLCCQCHGGECFTAEETRLAHEAVEKERRVANKYED